MESLGVWVCDGWVGGGYDGVGGVDEMMGEEGMVRSKPKHQA